MKSEPQGAGVGVPEVLAGSAEPGRHVSSEQPERVDSGVPDSGKRRGRSADRRARRRAEHWRLTERDAQIVYLTDRLRAVLDEHVRIAFFSTADSRCQRRLTLLRRHGYLDCLERQSVNDPAVYVLTRRSAAGTRLLRDRWGVAGRTKKQRPLGAVDHLLAINDVRVRVMRGCRDLEWSLRFWQHADDLAPFLAPVGLIPDAYFQIERDVDGQTRTSGFFLELERATKSNAVLRSKLKRYRELIETGLYERVFGTRALQILVVLASAHADTSARQLEAGLRAAEELGIAGVRFALLSDIKRRDPAACLTEPIWRVPGRTEPVALLRAAHETDGEMRP